MNKRFLSTPGWLRISHEPIPISRPQKVPPRICCQKNSGVIPHHKEIVLRYGEDPGCRCQFLVHCEGTVLVIERDRVPSHRHNALDQSLTPMPEHDDVTPA